MSAYFGANPLDVPATGPGSKGGGTTKLGPPAPKIVKVRAHTRTIKPKPAPEAQSVRPAQVSTVKRFAPNYKGEPIAGYTSGIRNLDRSWAKPGGKAQPGAYQADRPYFTDAYTTKHGAGPAGEESTQWNAAQVERAHEIQVANYGKPGYIARSLIPGGLNESPGSTSQAVSRAANIGSTLLPGGGVGEAAGVLGFGLKALRGARAGRDVAEAAPAIAEAAPAAAHATEEAAVIRGAMPGAKIVRGKQEEGYSVERSKRFAAANVHLSNQALPPEERLRRAKHELKGELPKIDYQGMKVLDGDALTKMQTDILNHPHLMPGQKIRAAEALSNAVAGKVPTKGELTLLEHVFGKDTADSLGQIHLHPFKDTLLSVLNVPRSLMASFDFSAPFRQGLAVATRHPVIFARNLGPMFKAFGNEKVYQAMIDEIKSRPSYPMMMKAKLSLTDLGRAVGEREEQFQSNIAEKIPVAGHGVRASGRAYTGFLDKTRADVFDHLIQRAQSQGVNVQGDKFLKDLGRYVNTATGRGPLGPFQGAATALNAAFFSPRLMASRLDLIFSPLTYAKADPFVRKEALRSMMQLAGTASTLLALASQIPGVKVGMDPRSADWGKIKLGNTRIDIGGGFQQYLRLFAQVGSGIAISSTTGKRLSLTAGQFGQPTRLDLFLRFFEGKESPIASLITDWARGSTQIGEKFSWDKAAVQRMIPLLAQDSHDLYKENHGGLNGLAAAFAGYAVGSVGFGMQTYGPPKPKTTPGAPADYFGGSDSGGGSPYFSSPSGSGGGGYFGK